MKLLMASGLLLGLTTGLTLTHIPQAKADANMGAAASYCERAADCLASGRGNCKKWQKLCNKETHTPEPK
jgi:hypothetical protein